MGVVIRNRTDRRVLLRFNSGVTRHLAPHEVLRGVTHVEVKGNARIRQLEERHVIALDLPAGRPAGGGPPRRSTEMRAGEAIAHIRRTPLGELSDFLAADEDRVSVVRAMEEKGVG